MAATTGTMPAMRSTYRRIVMLTKEEKAFLLEILDQSNVRGLAGKTMVVIIMGKLANEEDTDIPTPDADASE